MLEFGRAAVRSKWRFSCLDDDNEPSLSEVYGSITVPQSMVWLRRMFAFMGPGYMVSVGYMDPGNWATDLAGGASFGYTLLFVIMLSNLMAILSQALLPASALSLAAISLRPAAHTIQDLSIYCFGSPANWRSSPATWRK